jgi:hypothetical protein
MFEMSDYTRGAVVRQSVAFTMVCVSLLLCHWFVLFRENLTWKISTRNKNYYKKIFSGGEERPARKADNLTAIYEPIV